MKRRFFTILAALSFVMCVASCALWVRTYFVQDSICWWFKSDRSFGTITYPGELSFYVIGIAHDKPAFYYYRSGPPFTTFGFAPNDDQPLHIPWTLHYCRTSTVYTATYGKELSLGLWLIAVLFAVMPSWWLIRRIAVRRRFSDGCCRACGYDLRATPDRCPECGSSSKQVHN